MSPRTLVWRRRGDVECAEYGRAKATITRVRSDEDELVTLTVTSQDSYGIDDTPVHMCIPADHLPQRMEELKEHLEQEMMMRSIATEDGEAAAMGRVIVSDEPTSPGLYVVRPPRDRNR